MGTEEGFAKLYEERLVVPLRGVIEAYEGVPQSLMVLINQRSREVENSKEGNGGGLRLWGDAMESLAIRARLCHSILNRNRELTDL